MPSIPVRARRLLAACERLELRRLLSGNTGMTNIGQVDLPTGVPAQYSAGIDPTTGFGYFGSASGANPGIVSKVNLNGPLPTVVQDGLPNSIPLGVGHFNAIEVDTTDPDPAKHYLYVAGNAGHILKMSPGDATHDPQVVATLAATSAVGGILGGAIDTSSPDPTKRYAYFCVMESSDAKILRVRLSDFTDAGSETLAMGDVRTCGIDTIHHYLYCTSFNSAAAPAPQICKVNLATFTPGGTSTATYTMDSTTPGDGIAGAGFDTPGFDIGLVIDPIHQFAYLGSLGASSDPVKNETFPYNQSVIVRVNLGNGDAFPAHPLSELKLNVGERDLTAAVIDLANGNIYFGTDLTYPGHVYMIHVGDGTQPMTEVGRLDMNVGTAASYPPDGTVGSIPNNSPEVGGEIYFRSAILDIAQNAIYIGTDSRPGQIIKVGINGPTQPPAATQLAFAQPPPTATAGNPIASAVAVNVEDAMGNIVPTDASTVTLTLASGPPGTTLGGTFTAMAMNGVATFNNLVLTQAGTYTLTATDGTLASATSASFQVNAGPAASMTFTTAPANVTAGSAIQPATVVTLFDQYGNVASGDTSTVTLSLQAHPAGATLGGTVAIKVINGVATFDNVLLTKAGTYTLTATDGMLAFATSASFQVNAGPAASMTFTTPPANVTAGSAIQPATVVTLFDQYGNVASGDTSTVTLSLQAHPAGATLGGTVAAMVINGMATFDNLLLTKAGTYTLSASDGTLASATSASFQVNAGPAGSLTFMTPPANVTAGSAIQPATVVTLLDQYGNAASGDTSTVTLSLQAHPAGATLGGTTAAMVINGVATFDNVLLTKAGSYTLTAADGILASTTSASFQVNPGPAASLVFTTPPVNVTAGSAIQPATVVTVLDQYGNVASGDVSTVTLSLQAHPAGATLGGTIAAMAINGVATFGNLLLTKAGTYTLAANDGTLASATSASFQVNPGSAASLAFTTPPANVTAGSAIQPATVVTVFDQYGNVASGNTSTVTLSLQAHPAGATLGGTAAAMAVKGVAAFAHLILTTAGSYTLKAADGALAAVFSASFTVNPAAAAKLLFTTQPTNVTAGKAIHPAPAVTLLDQYGNVATGNTTTVTLSMQTHPTGGALGGTVAAKAVNGVATFANVVITRAGAYSLKAADGSLAAAISSSFKVSPSAAAKLGFAATPPAGKVHKALSPAVIVDVLDAFGNIVTTDKSTIALHISSGPAGSVLSGIVSETDTSGIATFSDLLLSKAGTYTLKATDGKLALALSATIKVS